MDVSLEDKGDFIVRPRNVLWREVARVGGTKELARAHVNLPSEAVKALELESKGDAVAFIIRKGSKNVILTNFFEPQPISAKWEKDPQILLEQLLSQVINLKSKKMEMLEKWENEEISNEEFTQTTQEIRSKFTVLVEKLKQIEDVQFRGATNTDLFIDERNRANYNMYATGLMDYSQDLTSKIRSSKKTLQALESAHSQGLFDKFEYLQDKEELMELSKFLIDLREKILTTLEQD